MRKKLIIIFLSLFLVISFMVGCRNHHAPQSSDNNPSVATPATKDLPLVAFVNKKVSGGKRNASNKYARSANAKENQKDQETANPTKGDQPSEPFPDKEFGSKSQGPDVESEGPDVEMDKEKKPVDEGALGLKPEDGHKPAPQTEGQDPLKKEEDTTPEEAKDSKSSSFKELIKKRVKFLNKKDKAKQTANNNSEEAGKLNRIRSESDVNDKKQRGAKASDKANKIKRTRSEPSVNQSKIKDNTGSMRRNTVDELPKKKEASLGEQVAKNSKQTNRRAREAEDIDVRKNNKDDLKIAKNPRRFFMILRKRNKVEMEGIHQQGVLAEVETMAVAEGLDRPESSVSEDKEVEAVGLNSTIAEEGVHTGGEYVEIEQPTKQAPQVLEKSSNKKGILNRIKSRRTNSSFCNLPVEKLQVDGDEQKRSKDDADIDALKKKKDKQSLKALLSPKKVLLSPRRFVSKFCKRNVEEKIGEDEIYAEEPIAHDGLMERNGNSNVDEKFNDLEGKKLDNRKSKITERKLRREKQKTDKHHKTNKKEKLSKNDAQKDSAADQIVEGAPQVDGVSVGEGQEEDKVKKKKKKSRSKEDQAVGSVLQVGDISVGDEKGKGGEKDEVKVKKGKKKVKSAEDHFKLKESRKAKKKKKGDQQDDATKFEKEQDTSEIQKEKKHKKDH